MPVAQIRHTAAKTSDTNDGTEVNQESYQAQPDRASSVVTRFVAEGFIFRIRATQIWVLVNRSLLQMSVFVVKIGECAPISSRPHGLRKMWE